MADDPLAAPNQDQTFGQKWGPLIGQAGGLVGSIYAGRAAQNSALQRSPEEAASLAGAMGSAGDLAGTGQSLLNESRPYVQQPASYYQTLLRGNRAAMANATAATRVGVNSLYRGQQAKIAGSGVRGAARDVLAGQNDRDRATAVAGLTTGVQGKAADALGKLGTDQLQTGVQAGNAAGNIYQQLLRQGADNRAQAMKEGTDTGKSAGKLLADLGTVAFGGNKKPGTPKPTPNPYDPSNPKSGYGRPVDPRMTYGEPPEPPPWEGPIQPDTGDYGSGGDYGKDYDPNSGAGGIWD